MALIDCSECKARISDKAAACLHCGAPLRAPLGSTIPVVAQEQPSFKWWLWIPLGLFGAFLLFGALIPKNVADANAFARVCRDMYAKGQVSSLSECDRAEAGIRDPSSSVNTSFVAEPPRAPSSASNEEISRQVLYPELYKNRKKQP